MKRWDDEEKKNDDYEKLLEKIWILNRNIIFLHNKLEKMEKIIDNLTEMYYNLEREVTRLKKDYTCRLLGDGT